MGRGQLTDKVQEICMNKINRKISLKELRLFPYIQYVMMNEQKLDIQKIDSKERDILQSRRDSGFIDGGASGLSITKDFWDFMNEVLFYSYVEY